MEIAEDIMQRKETIDLPDHQKYWKGLFSKNFDKILKLKIYRRLFSMIEANNYRLGSIAEHGFIIFLLQNTDLLKLVYFPHCKFSRQFKHMWRQMALMRTIYYGYKEKTDDELRCIIEEVIQITKPNA